MAQPSKTKEKISISQGLGITIVTLVGMIGVGVLLFAGGKLPKSSNTSITNTGGESVTSTTVWYVDNSCATAGNGSTTTCGATGPFKTISTAVTNSSLVAGQSIKVKATGTPYSESTITTQDLGPITITRYDTDTTNPVWTGTGGSRLAINNNYWTIDRVTIDQAGLANDAIKIGDATHYVNNTAIQNCELKNGQREGISINNASFVTVQDCTIHDFFWFDGSQHDAHCIMLDTSIGANLTDPALTKNIHDVVIQRNTITKCSGDGTQIFGWSESPPTQTDLNNPEQPISGYAKNIAFLDNTFIDGTAVGSGQTENAIDIKAGDGVIIRGNTMSGYTNNKTIVIQKGDRNITIENNVLSDGLSGIEMRNEVNANPLPGHPEHAPAFVQLNQRVVGNLIYNMSDYAMKFDGVYDAVIANNTLANIGTQAFRFDRSYAMPVTTITYVDYSLAKGKIQNNLMYNVGSAPTKVSTLGSTCSGCSVTVDHNGWFNSSAGGSWATKSGLSSTGDKTGTTDPGFVNAAGSIYTLHVGSPVIDVGVDVGWPFNPTAPDFGAYEYGGANTNSNTGSGGGSGCKDLNHNKRIDPGECLPLLIPA